MLSVLDVNNNYKAHCASVINKIEHYSFASIPRGVCNRNRFSAGVAVVRFVNALILRIRSHPGLVTIKWAFLDFGGIVWIPD